jgi:hypothetical protein
MPRAGALPADRALQLVGAACSALSLLGLALLLWSLMRPAAPARLPVTLDTNGALDTPLPALLRSTADTIDVSLTSAPDARVRATLRALRGSGHLVQVSTPRALAPLAVSAEEEWRAAGGARVQLVGGEAMSVAVGDAAGMLDSVRVPAAGVRLNPGPLEGVLRGETRAGVAAVAPLAAGAPDVARVLVLGSASWESRFLIATLEESGWTVDAAVTISPRVTVTQGPARTPSRARHAIVVLLPGTSTSVVSTLPQFVRDGGALVIVGEAARLPGLAALRAGVPGRAIAGEPGAEASDAPRHGLDVVPITALAAGAVILESRDGRTTMAARRIGAGRVVQVGYENSWVWRMAGNDDAPVAHRRWWTSLLSGVVAVREPLARVMLTGASDTLDGAPLAALARDIGMPTVREAAVTPVQRAVLPALDPRLLVVLTLLSLVASWLIRRWRGLV